jgi:DNA-binding MarR family transcriptional regulator
VQFVLLASLWWLERHGAAPTQAELAAQAGTDPMMTSQVSRRLEARGLLARRADPADSRARRLELTSAGSELLAPALADVEAADAAYFGVLDRRSADALVGSLQVLAGPRSDQAEARRSASHRS